MPSFRDILGLGALTSWLPGSSKIDKDGAFNSEIAVKNAMQAARSLGSGSTEYFDAIAHVYGDCPSQVAYGKFLKGLINRLREHNWIALDPEKRGGVRVIDYAAGTGLLSHALAPHATKILAIDKSAKMVEEYNSIVAGHNKTKCEMKAIQGDITSHFLTGRKIGIEQPDGVSSGFDVVAMCFAVDYFTHTDVDDEEKHKELMRALDVIVSLIEQNGTLLIIDVEKCEDYEDILGDEDLHSPGSPHEGLKTFGHGSKDITRALEELGMEDVASMGNQHFLFEVKRGKEPDSPTIRRKETYFALKAKRGPRFENRLTQRSQKSR